MLWQTHIPKPIAPHRNRGFVASALLLVFGLLYIIILLSRLNENSALLTTISHALEGGIVGGLCDWFAVWKTYHTAEQRRSEVAAAIGQWVERELLTASVIQRELDTIFTRQDVRDRFYLWLDERIGSLEDAAQIIRDACRYVEPLAVEEIVGYRLSPEEVTSLEQAVTDEALIQSAAFCTGSALEKLADTPEFSRVARRALEAWPFIDFLDKIFKVVDIPTSVQRLGKRLREGQFHEVGSVVTQLVGEDDTRQAVTLFLHEYIRSWNNLPVARRRAAVTGLLSHLREPCIWALAKVFVRQRDHLRRARVLAAHPLLQELRRRVQSLLNDDLAKAVGDAVQRALSDIPAHEFRRNLEHRTRLHLEAIRINGSVLGLALGALLGLLDAISR